MSFSEVDRKRAANIAYQSKVWSEQPRKFIDGLHEMEESQVVSGVMQSLSSERVRTKHDQAIKCPLNLLLTAAGFVLTGRAVDDGLVPWYDLQVQYFQNLEMTAEIALKMIRNRVSDYLSDSRED